MPTPARFGRYRAENFRTVAQKYGAQRVAGVFFKKKARFGDTDLPSWRSGHQILRNYCIPKKCHESLLKIETSSIMQNTLNGLGK